jgi:hypothetical protein
LLRKLFAIEGFNGINARLRGVKVCLDFRERERVEIEYTSP